MWGYRCKNTGLGSTSVLTSLSKCANSFPTLIKYWLNAKKGWFFSQCFYPRLDTNLQVAPSSHHCGWGMQAQDKYLVIHASNHMLFCTTNTPTETHINKNMHFHAYIEVNVAYPCQTEFFSTLRQLVENGSSCRGLSACLYQPSLHSPPPPLSSLFPPPRF